MAESLEFTQSTLDALAKDLDKFDSFPKEYAAQREFLSAVKEIYKSTDNFKSATPETTIPNLIKLGQSIGGVDDIVAKVSRDILRINKQDIDQESGVSEIFDEYGINLPPISSIKFKDYEDLETEQEKVDGWAAVAKANFNLHTKNSSPELLAYRDSVFQKIDDTASYMKRKIGATDSKVVDFLNRIGEGSASFLDSVGLDSAAEFLRQHTAENPEWDSDTSAVVGSAIGQVATLIPAIAAGTAAILSTPITGSALGAGLISSGLIGGISSLNAAQKEVSETVERETGSENLGIEASNDPSVYAGVVVDTASDMLLALGIGALGKVGKIAKNLSDTPSKIKFVDDALKEAGKGISASAKVVKNAMTPLEKLAPYGGDIAVQAAQEGAAEVLQGALQDSTISSYIGDPTKYNAWDIRARAQDFIGGAAGGAVGSVIAKRIMPRNEYERIRDANGGPDTIVLPTDDFSSAESTFSGDPTSMADRVKLIQDAAQDDAANMTDNPPNSTDPQDFDGFDKEALYNAVKNNAGYMLDIPEARTETDIMLAAANRMRGLRDDPFVPKVVTTPDDPIGTTTTEELLEAASDPVSDIETELYKAGYSRFNDITTTTNEDGSRIINFTNSATDVGDSSIDLGAAQDVIGNADSQSGSIIRKGQGARDSNVSYALTINKDGTFGDLVETRLNTTRTPRYTEFSGKDGTSQRVQAIDDDGEPIYDTVQAPSITTTPIKDLSEATKALRISNPEIAEQASAVNYDVATDKKNYNFMRSKFPLAEMSKHTTTTGQRVLTNLTNPGGPLTKSAKKDYLRSEAFENDLVELGIPVEEATALANDVSGILQAIEQSPRTGEGKSRTPEALATRLKSVQRRIASRIIPFDVYRGIEQSAADSYADTKVGKEATDYLDTEAQNLQSLPNTEPVNDLSMYDSLAESDEVMDAFLRNIGETTLPKDKDGNVSDAAIEKYKSQLRNNPRANARYKRRVNRFLDERNVNPSATPTEVADMLYNTGAEELDFNKGNFKQSYLDAVIPSQGSTLFGVGETLRRMNELPITNKKFQYFEDQENISGEADPKTGQISVAREALRSKQGMGTVWHEVGERATQQDPTMYETIQQELDANGLDLDTLTKQASDDVRETPTDDAHEQFVDSLARYVFDPDALRRQSPALAGAFDSYIRDNPESFLSRYTQTKQSVENTPIETLIEDLEARITEERAKANAAMAGRNKPLSARQKLRKLKTDVTTMFLDRDASVKKLSKYYEDLVGPTVARKVIEPLYKSMRQLNSATAMADAAAWTYTTQVFEAYAQGVTPEQLDRYLSNMWIRDGIAKWEYLLSKFPVSATAGVLGASPIFDSYYKKTQYANSPIASLSQADLFNLIDTVASLAYNDGNRDKMLTEIRDAASNSNRELAKHVINALSTDALSRGKIGNYGNVDAGIAAQSLDQLRAQLTPTQWEAVEKVLGRQSDMTTSLMQESFDNGTISKDQLGYYLSNTDVYSRMQAVNAILDDPFAKATLASTKGYEGVHASPTVTNPVFYGAIIRRNAAAANSNAVVTMMYDIEKFHKAAYPSYKQKIEPVFATREDGKAHNPWVVDNEYGSKFTPDKYVSLSRLYEKQQALNKSDPTSSYIVSWRDGQAVLHRVADLSVGNKTDPFAEFADSLKAVTQLQAITRQILTAASPTFWARSYLRMQSNLYSMDYKNMDGKNKTLAQFATDMLTAPIFGAQLNPKLSNLNTEAKTLVEQYRQGMNDPARRMTGFLGRNKVWNNLNDLLNDPDVYLMLEHAGALPTSLSGNISTGLDSGDIGGTLYSDAQRRLKEILAGKPNDGILNRVQSYGGIGSDGLKAVVKALDTATSWMIDKNDALEMREKMAGLMSALNMGLDGVEAIDFADKYSGNPNSRTKASMQSLINSMFLFFGPTMKGAQNIYDMGKGAVGMGGYMGSAKRSGNTASAEDFGYGEPGGSGGVPPIPTDTGRNYGEFDGFDSRAYRAMGQHMRNKFLSSKWVMGGIAYALARAMGASDEEARKRAEVMESYLNTIPENDRWSGFTIPTGLFRDQRTGEIHWMGNIEDPASIDPSWTALYFQAPYDHNTIAFTNSLGGLVESLDAGNAPPQIIANMLQNGISSSIPSLGPNGTVLSAGSAMLKGNVPVDDFTGQPIVSDDLARQGGLGLGAAYAQYLLSQYIPIVPYNKNDPKGRSKLGQMGIPVYDQVVNAIKSGVMLKESNYGRVQTLRRAQQVQDAYEVAVKADLSTDVVNTVARQNELDRVATERMSEYKDSIRAQGQEPDKVKSIDFLPEQMQNQLAKLRIWRRTYYNPLKEKAEIEYRANGKTPVYYQFIQDITDSIPKFE